MKTKLGTREITIIGMLGAIATVLMLFEIPLPFAPPFYEIDFSDTYTSDDAYYFIFNENRELYLENDELVTDTNGQDINFSLFITFSSALFYSSMLNIFFFKNF